MFGSGYNPYRAQAYAQHQRELEAAPWGEKIYIFPKGFDVEKYKEFLYYSDGEIREDVYKELLKNSGFLEKIEKLRKKAAIELASLEWVRKEKIYHSSDAYGRPYTSKIETKCLEDEVLERNIKKAELIVGKKAQHPELEKFWNVLIKEINKYLPQGEQISKW